jgi:hypothetical protein
MLCAKGCRRVSVYSMMKTTLEQDMLERKLTYCSSVRPSMVMSPLRKSVG